MCAMLHALFALGNWTLFYVSLVSGSSFSWCRLRNTGKLDSSGRGLLGHVSTYSALPGSTVDTRTYVSPRRLVELSHCFLREGAFWILRSFLVPALTEARAHPRESSPGEDFLWPVSTGTRARHPRHATTESLVINHRLDHHHHHHHQAFHSRVTVCTRCLLFNSSS